MYETAVAPIWNALRERFTKMATGLNEQSLTWKLGAMSIGDLLKHTAEVEYMFAEWFFDKQKPANLPTTETLPEILELLAASNQHLIDAMKAMPEDQWNTPIESPMGTSTPSGAIGRLMYHAGIHAGQIALIKKEFTEEASKE
ncbi:DinB family protein [Ornithinibacillus gellani]|uniref:DinB family protein n=1 Tax=Ornithinibacillus gellani TaxID=2293253 RepID=UPI000F4ADB13|nr:DinB family protein [Ornithinibacillus gellani]TQS76184.1 DinB family protein [Ornithinibacillus gellani]